MSLLLIAAAVFINSCAGEDSDVDKARYWVGDGSQASAISAVEVLEPLLNTATGDRYLEIVRLYTGAKLTAGGFLTNQLLAHVVYYKNTPGNSKALGVFTPAMKGIATDFTKNLADSEAALSASIDSSSFAPAEKRDQSGLFFQRGLVRQLKSVRILIQDTGFLTAGSSLTQSDCETNLKKSLVDRGYSIDDVAANLNYARTDFKNAELMPGNKLYDLVSDITNSVASGSDSLVVAGGTDNDKVTTICQYTVSQGS